MSLIDVTVCVRGREDREIRVRVTDRDVAKVRESGAYSPRVDDETIREDVARDRAAVRLYGRGVRWQSSGVVRHRGQVWQSVRGMSGESAVTDEITMRVSP